MNLLGKTVAITRPTKQAVDFAKKIRKHGGKPLIAPTIELKAIKDLTLIKRFIKMINENKINFVIFTSVNGVYWTFRLVTKFMNKKDLAKKLNNTIIIAIGPKTAHSLIKNGVNVNFVPSEFSTNGILKDLKKFNLSGKTVALLRTFAATKLLKNKLDKMSARIFEIPIYETALPKDVSKIKKLVKFVLKKKIDIITFTSSQATKNFFKVAHKICGNDEIVNALNESTKIAVIGPKTKKTLEKFGVHVDIMPNEYTTDCLIQSILKFQNGSKS